MIGIILIKMFLNLPQDKHVTQKPARAPVNLELPQFTKWDSEISEIMVVSKTIQDFPRKPPRISIIGCSSTTQ